MFSPPLLLHRAYDRAAIKFRGPDADINFNLTDYDDMKQVSSSGEFYIPSGNSFIASCTVEVLYPDSFLPCHIYRSFFVCL
jgi:hypothetical protein